MIWLGTRVVVQKDYQKGSSRKYVINLVSFLQAVWMHILDIAQDNVFFCNFVSWASTCNIIMMI